ncbi:unnamed protein product [Rodentolepis nana]|uniref:Secreted protein n=1 Tax=Rodentolepis nana TaxID=102285 RepID=A0A0R3TDL6_RODNA|nr:unnamed protein product [Rodentolepis nana]
MYADARSPPTMKKVFVGVVIWVLSYGRNALSPPVIPIQETPPEPATETEQVATFDQNPSIHHPQINYENYQQIYLPDDDSLCEPSAPYASDLSETSSGSSDEMEPPDDFICFTTDEIMQAIASSTKEPDLVCLAKPLNNSDSVSPFT